MLASNERPSVSMHLKIIGIVVIFNHATTLLPNPAKILRYKYLACFTAQSLDAQDILPLQALASQWALAYGGWHVWYFIFTLKILDDYGTNVCVLI